MKQTKILGLTLLLLLDALILRGQGWDKIYPSNLYATAQTNANTLAEAKNGDFIAAEVLLTGLNLMRVDKDGNFLWQKKYTFPIYAHGTKISIVCLLDGSVLVKGFADFEIRGQMSRTYILKTNANGDSISFKKSLVASKCYEMIGTRDNNLLVAEDAIEGASYLAKINSTTGDTMWKKSYIFSDYAYLTETNDKKIALLYGQNREKLDRIDGNGNMLWSRNINTAVNNLLSGLDIVGTIDNGIVSLVQYATPTNQGYNTLIKYNSEGVLEWNSSWGSSPNPYLNNARMIPTRDSSVICFSLIYGVFEKFDNTGQIDWIRPRGIRELYSHAIKTSDNGFFISGISYLSNRTTAVRLIKTDQDGFIYYRTIKGKVVQINNCFSTDTIQIRAKNWLVKAEKGNNEFFWSVTDSLGRYSLAVDSSEYHIRVIPPNFYWETCQPFVSVPAAGPAAVSNIDLPVIPKSVCPYMLVDISNFGLRRCFNNIFYVKYCNQGTTTAQNARIEVKLDSLLEYVSATRPLSNRTGQTLIFNLGNVAALDCGNFSITARVRCGDSTRIGQTLCTEAHIYPDTICNPPANWSGANVVVGGRCDRDSVRFLIKNTTGIPTAPLRRIVVEDEIVFLNGTNNIPANATQTITLPANGKTWRLNQQQEPNNPRNALVTAVVEGCRVGTNNFSTNFVNDFPNNSGDPSVSTSCLPIVGSFEPNEKLAFPEGFKTPHFIEQNTPIDYQIGFQNTGTDTAFTVILRDTLDKSLDIATLLMGASSHAFTWELVGKNVLTISFDNIKLVDSFRNEAASHGFVKFRINQKKDMSLGTIINNQAAIYFDFNRPVFTNTTFHTVGKNVLRVSVASVVDKKTTIKVSPNPFSEHTTFELDPSVKTSIFELFDVNGRLLRRETFDNSRFEFQKQDLPTGIFIFKISTVDGRLIGNGKVVAQ